MPSFLTAAAPQVVLASHAVVSLMSSLRFSICASSGRKVEATRSMMAGTFVGESPCTYSYGDGLSPLGPITSLKAPALEISSSTMSRYQPLTFFAPPP